MMRRSINLKTPLRKAKKSRTAMRPGCLCIQSLELALPQVEYLNSGIAFSSSLVALKTAWSGHQGFGFDAVVEVAAPVVVVEPGRVLAPPAGALAAPV